MVTIGQNSQPRSTVIVWLCVLAVIDTNDDILASVVLLQLKFRFLLDSSAFMWVTNSLLHKKNPRFLLFDILTFGVTELTFVCRNYARAWCALIRKS